MSDDQTNLTLRQRKRLQKSDNSSVGDAAEGPKSKRRLLRTLLAAGLVILLGVGGAWAWMHFNRGNDARYQEVLALQAKANSLDTPIGKDAFDLYKQIHDKTNELPDDLKKQAEDNGRNAMQARMNRFFVSSSEDQLAMLDKIILGVQAMEAMRNVQSALGGKPAANAGADSGKPSGGQGNGSGGHGWGGTDTQRMQGMQKMLSNLTPQQRAQWGMGRQMFNARMQQQGATPPPGGIF